MSNVPTSSPRGDRRALARQLAAHAAGLIAVILGGWCLWLAFAATPRPIAIEADNEASQAPQPIEPQASDRPLIEITSVSPTVDSAEREAAHVIPAVRFEGDDPPAPAIEPVRHARPAAEPASGAWLTGTIDASDPAPEPPAPIRPWKRSAKSRP